MDLLFATAGVSSFALLGYGFLLGLKHATEADHLAAVSVIVSERRSIWSSALVGGLWGLGHTLALLTAGIFVLLLDLQISGSVENWLEFAVGVMLTLLGLNVLLKIARGGHLHFHTHQHGGRVHAHPHLHKVDEKDERGMHHLAAFTPRALLIGMVHGLAGSAALMLLIIPLIGSRAMGLVYILVFGAGSVGGMILMGFLVGLPFHLTSSRFNVWNRCLQGGAGLMSLAIGLWIIYERGSEGMLG